MKSVIDACTPRQEILERDAGTEYYAADLQAVVDGKAPDVYLDAKKFFQNTFPTAGLKQTAREAFGRLAGDPKASPVIQLETGLGGGKTHTLIALYHLARQGAVCKEAEDILGKLKLPPTFVVALEGPSLPVSGNPGTLWGALAKPIGQKAFEEVKRHDKEQVAPEKGILGKVFDPKTKYLVLLDEIALYLVKASGKKVGDSGLSNQTVAFLQSLAQFAASAPNVTLVITSLDTQTVFSEQTQQFQEILKRVEKAHAEAAVREGQQVLSRLVHNLKPAGEEEFGGIVRKRLFTKVDAAAAKSAADAHYRAFQDPAVAPEIPDYARQPTYAEAIEENYPFHPELVRILREKTSTIPNFNRTRGVLRLLSIVLRNFWKTGSKDLLIHADHVDLQVGAIQRELVDRLDYAPLQAAIQADIYNETGSARASIVDKNYKEPWGTRAATTIFLHSLVGASGSQVKRGATEDEIQLALHRPGLDPKVVRNALKDLEEKGFHLHRDGPYLLFKPHPSLNKVIEGAKSRIEQSRVWQELERRIKDVYGGKVWFEPIFFPTEPAKVPDDTNKVKLVVLHFNEASAEGARGAVPDLVRSLFEKQGTQGKPRIYANNLTFLVSDTDERDNMEEMTRSVLALTELVKRLDAKELPELSEGQGDQLKARLQEEQLYLRIAIVLAYRHLYVPSPVGEVLAPSSRRPLKHIALKWTEQDVRNRMDQGQTEQDVIKAALIDHDVARDPSKDPVSPEYVLHALWRHQKPEAVSTDEFRRLFYKDPAAGLHFSDELIKKTVVRGVKENKWYAVAEGKFHYQKDHTGFVPLFNDDTNLVLVATDLGRQTLEKYTKPADATASAGMGGTLVVTQLAPPKARNVSFSKATLERIGRELAVRLEENDLDSVQTIELRPNNRDAFIKVLNAAPQFIGATLELNCRMKLDERYKSGNKLEAVYEGDLKGALALKSLWVNYEAQSEGVDFQGTLRAQYKDSLAVADVVSLIAERVGKFTQEGSFDATFYGREEVR